MEGKRGPDLESLGPDFTASAHLAIIGAPDEFSRGHPQH